MSERTRGWGDTPKRLQDRVDLIGNAIDEAKNRAISRILKKLRRMSASDLAALERLLR